MTLHSVVRQTPDPRRDALSIANAERGVHPTTWYIKPILVVPLDPAAPTSLVTALLTIAATRILAHVNGTTPYGVLPCEPVAIDTDPARPVATLLGASTGGDLASLADPSNNLSNLEIDAHTDQRTHTRATVIAAQPGQPALTAPQYEHAASLIAVRHGGYLADITPTTADTLLPTALHLTRFVIAVATDEHIPPWLHDTPNPVQPFLDTARLAIVHPHGTTTTTHQRYNIETPSIGLHLPPPATHNPLLGRHGIDLRHADTQTITAIINTLDTALTRDP